MERIPESGGLDAHPLPRLLLELRRSRFAGALVLTRERTEKRFLFQEGTPVFAESNVPSESLGVQLMDAGTLTRDDHARVSQLVQERGCREGAALLELGLLGPKDLFLALKEQVRRRLLDCFGWATGQFRLEPGEDGVDDVQPLRIDPLQLVQDGLARHWPPDRLLQGLAPRMDRYPSPGTGFDGLLRRLGDEDGVVDFLGEIDGSESLGSLLERATTPAVLAVTWIVDAAGALEWQDTASSADGDEQKPEPRFEIAFEDVAAGRDEAASGEAQTARESRAGAGAAKLRREVEERHAQLADLDFYGVLDIEREANAGAIKRAYFATAKRYHPDALASLGLEDLRRQATALFARVAKAYATLSDPEARRNYDAELDGHVAADADRLANAEALFRKGEIMLRAGDFRGALQFLEPAVRLWPEDGAYQSALGWALFKKTPPDNDQAREHLEKAVSLAERDATAHLRLSVVLRDMGEAEAADGHASRAKQLDPKVTAR
jgi:tetratricopeptide (TPR) repeat protein